VQKKTAKTFQPSGLQDVPKSIFWMLIILALLGDRSLFMGFFENHGVGQAYFLLEKRGGPKENFTMVGGGSLCVL